MNGAGLIAGAVIRGIRMPIGDLTDFELRLLKWISASDFVEIPWSTKRAAEAFKVEEKDVYEALAALTFKVRDNIQIFYDDGAIRIDSHAAAYPISTR
jgi:hypothetical protein